MNLVRRKGIHSMVAIFVAVIMIVAMVVPVFAQQGPEIRVTDSESRADQPDVAIDSQGNVHIAYCNYGITSYYQTFGTSPNRYIVIEWDTCHISDGEPGKFQAVLYENGNVDINISDNTGAVGQSPITGVNQGDGTHGVDIGGRPASGTSYRFSWDGVSDYTWSAIAYNWVDASGGAGIGADEDDSSGTVPIGFSFTFYGSSYNTVYVSSNGYMSFTNTDPTTYSNPTSFPDSSSTDTDVIAPLWTDWYPGESAESREIWYSMLDNNGDTLIDDTRITPNDGKNSVRPAIVVDSNDKVHIAWQDYRPASEHNEIYYTKLDPYLDGMDGDGADESVITLIQDKMVSDDNDDYSEPVRMAIDSDDNMHLVWREYGTALFYAKIDNDGNKIIDDVMLASGDFSGRPSVSVAVDSNNNAHIAWNDDENTDSDETYYKMLDGSDGSTLIDATLITPNDGYKSKGQSIVVDHEDKVHIIWKDQRGDGQAVYYTKLDPSLDDQDTGPADESVITLIDDMAISTDAGDYWVKRVASAIHCGHYINISWWEDYDDDNYGYLYYMVLDTDGNTEVTERTLTTDETVTTSTAWTVPYLDVDSNGKAHITWCDNRDGDFYEVYYTNYQGPACLTPPTPSYFSATPTTGPTPLEVQFTDDSACDFTSWSWDFGDGGTSNEQSPMHVYTRPGPFTVSLISSGGPCQNRTATKVDYIHPYTMGVGGEAYPVNKVSLIAPWLGLVLLLAGGGILAMRRRRA